MQDVHDDEYDNDHDDDVHDEYDNDHDDGTAGQPKASVGRNAGGASDF